MIRRPTLRGISLVATSSLLALMLFGPAGTLAATPVLTTTSASLPTTVSAGATGAFFVDIHNADTSTVSQLFAVISLSGGTTLSVTPSPQGTCSLTACTLGQLKPNSDITLTILYTAQAAEGTATAVVTFNTTGTAGTGDKSHGDSWTERPSAHVSTDTLNFSGRYLNTTDLTVANNQSVNGSSNRQATKVIAPNSLIGVTVSDGTTSTACTATIVCFGEDSVISVAAGATFEGGFRVIITIDSSEIPAGVNANNIKIYHAWSGSPAPGYEIISLRCTFTGGFPNSMPCLNVNKVNGNDLELTIWTKHNGFMKPAG